MSKHEEAIILAAEWWVRRIQILHHDNGDRSRECEFAMILADMLAAKNRATEDQLDKFKIALINRLKMENADRNIYLSCDYGPDYILGEAANMAGVNYNVFPYKVSTYITPDGKFMVRDGYGASVVEVKNEDLK